GRPHASRLIRARCLVTGRPARRSLGTNSRAGPHAHYLQHRPGRIRKPAGNVDTQEFGVNVRPAAAESAAEPAARGAPAAGEYVAHAQLGGPATGVSQPAR